MNLNNDTSNKRKNKILIISKIDELKVIANNHYLMNRYDEAIKVAGEIISLAKEAGLSSIVKEQVKFINKTYKLVGETDQKLFVRENFEELEQKFKALVEDKKILEAHKLVEKFKNSYQEIIELKTEPSIASFLKEEEKIWNKFYTEQKKIQGQLDPLLIQLESYIKTNNVTLAKETIQKAKKLIEDIKNEDIREKWKVLKTQYNQIKHSYDIHEELEKLMSAISKLTDKYKFREAKEILKTLTKIVSKNDIEDYEDKIKLKERSISDAKEKYDKLIEDIIELEEQVEKNITNFAFEDAITNCEQIVKIARFIGKKDYIEKYSDYLNDIKSKINKYDEFEELKHNIITLHKEALELLSSHNFDKALASFKEIKEKLNTNLKKK